MKQKKVYLLGIGGSAMSNLAGMFVTLGWKVLGSDQKVYSPASDYLSSQNISYFEGYDADHIDETIDLVVIGNVVSKDNPEVMAVVEKKLPFLSMPGALFEYFMKDKERIAVCGTHGKTTTTSLLAWIFYHSLKNPSYFVGGIPKNFGKGFEVSKGNHFIIEGDEYDTAFFEKTPKFLHYHPQHAIISSIEFDHADIYKDFDHVFEQFEKLIEQKPQTIVACVEQPSVQKLIKNISHAIGYGESQGHYQYRNVQNESFGQSFDVWFEDCVLFRVKTRLLGKHNRLNILACVAMARVHGIEHSAIQEAIWTFEGVVKRQEFLAEKNGVAIYFDFAHHPSAIATTIDGFLPVAKARGGRLIVALEPRSNTMRRKIFEKSLPESLSKANIVLMYNVFQKKDKLNQDQLLDPAQVVLDLQKMGSHAFFCEDAQSLLTRLSQEAKPNDIVVFMSNGDFQSLPKLAFQEK